MLVHRKINNFELKYIREFLKNYVTRNVLSLLIAKIALDVLELTVLICFFHVKCVFLKT